MIADEPPVEFWIAVDRLIVRHPKLTPIEKLVWINLKLRRGLNETAFPSIETQANDTGIGQSTIKRALVRLRDLGLIGYPKSEGGKHVVNRYHVFEPAFFPDPKIDYTSPQRATIKPARKGLVTVSQTSPQRADTSPHRAINQPASGYEVDSEKYTQEADSGVARDARERNDGNEKREWIDDEGVVHCVDAYGNEFVTREF